MVWCVRCVLCVGVVCLCRVWCECVWCVWCLFVWCEIVWGYAFACECAVCVVGV